MNHPPPPTMALSQESAAVNNAEIEDECDFTRFDERVHHFYPSSTVAVLWLNAKRSTLCYGDGSKRLPEAPISDAMEAAHEEDTSQPNIKLFDVCFCCEMCIGSRDDNMVDVAHGEGHLEELELRIPRDLRPGVMVPHALVESSSYHVAMTLASRKRFISNVLWKRLFNINDSNFFLQ
ncbi:hypothetical protein HJC23_004489 [Cyclotella cryptica]|uniref:Uncharacterized protein n=1 Tax=Cyclotella cryptica TaxID=29204 RepID=A0ABD3PTC5_9STRA